MSAEQRRAWINVQMPKWDGKLVLAGIFIIGYYGLVFALVLSSATLSDNKAGMVRDAMLTLGPPIGLIFGALFRTTGAEERAQALRSADLQTAIATPSVVSSSEAVADNVEEGARAGTRAGVNDALGPRGGAAGSDPTAAGYDGHDIPDMPADLPANIRGA